MRSFAVLLLVIACLTLGLTGVSFAAPEWTTKTGLDFWNFDEEENNLRGADEETRRLEAISERQAVRIAVSDRIASDLCEERITLDEALDELAALAQDDPDWFANLRYSFWFHGSLPQTAADRDVLACYLRGKIVSMQGTAMQLGDPSRAAFIHERLARLGEEVKLRHAP